jgi:hypothetical protein
MSKRHIKAKEKRPYFFLNIGCTASFPSEKKEVAEEKKGLAGKLLHTAICLKKRKKSGFSACAKSMCVKE